MSRVSYVVHTIESTVMSRVSYVVHTIESTAWLIGSYADKAHTDAILERAHVMISNVWTCVHKVSHCQPGAAFAFWDAVAGSLNKSIVYSFQALTGEQVNPPGEVGNVRLTFQVSQAARYLIIYVALNDRMGREDYDLICEKAGEA